MAQVDDSQVLHFWFHEVQPAQWWAVDAEFDACITERFKALHASAAAAELSAWRHGPQGRLAEILVLDQFSRNMFRGTPAAFASDAMALVLAQEAIAAGALQALNPVERSFLLLPLMHSESAFIHAQAEPLYRQYAPTSNWEFELRHKEIIDRFGRYPHRNAILGRVSTDEELHFLTLPGSRF